MASGLEAGGPLDFFLTIFFGGVSGSEEAVVSSVAVCAIVVGLVLVDSFVMVMRPLREVSSTVGGVGPNETNEVDVVVASLAGEVEDGGELEGEGEDIIEGTFGRTEFALD